MLNGPLSAAELAKAGIEANRLHYMPDLRTGRPTRWCYSCNFGCNMVIGSRWLLTFRSAAAGCCELAGDSEDRQFMLLAIELARRGIECGQRRFGAVIVRSADVLAAAHNTVWSDGYPTAHAEINAIRRAAAAVGSIDLYGSTIYCTCEPCRMCLAALPSAKVDVVIYGATIADAAEAGFSELTVPAAELAAGGGSHLKVQPGPLAERCRQLFQLWRKREGHPAY